VSRIIVSRSVFGNNRAAAKAARDTSKGAAIRVLTKIFSRARGAIRSGPARCLFVKMRARGCGGTGYSARTQIEFYEGMAMPGSFFSRLTRGPMLCDGAMGTLLYAKGIFINRCYDELNVSQPELVRGIHLDYLNAGADIIETNTFGANAFRLQPHQFADRVRDFNLAGARVAREAAKDYDAYVAGAVGPLGVRIEPLGKIAFEEARTAFRQQIEALAEGGVDLIILETFGYLEELHQAILAAREVDPRLPLVAQITIDDNGDCLDGATAETAAKKLDSWGADVIGCNCGGPVTVLSAIERMAQVTRKPLSAQSNAGTPRNVQGRNIYLCSPEYMANAARGFLAAGAKIVGGCCGTTPEQIRAMKAEVLAGMARSSAMAVATESAEVTAVAAPALQERSRLGARLAAGEFVTMAEILPPRGIDTSRELEGARFLKAAGIDALNVPDSPRASARMGNQALCVLIQQLAGIEAVLHYSCRDRTVHGIESDLLGACAMGLRNLLCLTGDPPPLGAYPDATAVFDVDSIGLVNIVRNLNRGLDIGGNAVGTATSFVIGVAVNPGAPNLDEELRRFEYKVEAGAEFCVTQPVFDSALLENFIQRTQHCRIPVIAAISVLTSARQAEFMRDEMRVSVPDAILERMARAGTAEAAQADGVAIAREMLFGVKDMVQGAKISAPAGRYSSVLDVLEVLGSTRRASV
jgi:methionine synthase I (cobalamin-dependent)/5,10-methylenetetrahydrofolate reductase